MTNGLVRFHRASSHRGYAVVVCVCVCLSVCPSVTSRYCIRMTVGWRDARRQHNTARSDGQSSRGKNAPRPASFAWCVYKQMRSGACRYRYVAELRMRFGASGRYGFERRQLSMPGQTDGRTDGHPTVTYRPCTACSVYNKQRSLPIFFVTVLQYVMYFRFYR